MSAFLTLNHSAKNNDQSGLALTNSSGIEITVSKKCPALNKEAEIKEACRGSIHYEQILSFKVGDDTEVDHCNDGGFKNIYCKWRATIPESTEQLYEKVVKNDMFKTETTKIGDQTFQEPILTQWKTFEKGKTIYRCKIQFQRCLSIF